MAEIPAAPLEGLRQEARQRRLQGEAARGLAGSSKGGLRCHCRKVLLLSGLRRQQFAKSKSEFAGGFEKRASSLQCVFKR